MGKRDLIDQIDSIAGELQDIAEHMEVVFAGCSEQFLIAGILEQSEILNDIYNDFCWMEDL